MKCERPENSTNICKNLIFLVALGTYSHGNCINVNKLNNVEKNLTKEYYDLKKTVDNTVKEVMGDGVYNLSSGEDLSKIIYSRKLQDKNIWKEIFNIGTTNGKQNKIK